MMRAHAGTFMRSMRLTLSMAMVIWAGSLAIATAAEAAIPDGNLVPKPTNNYGAASTMGTDSSPVKNILLKFTVSGVGTRSVKSAKLRLYCVDSSAKGGDFYRVGDTSWQENSVTWSTAPAAGLTALSSLGGVSAGTWYDVDVSSLVTGDGTYSVKVTTTSKDGADYSTKEGSAAFVPQLIVTLN